ncbi:MAG: hypothetical protein R3335_05530 [Anaerolineales bacterium]|nr:hypothetical protein [Anaerolineales bacterium]
MIDRQSRWVTIGLPIVYLLVITALLVLAFDGWSYDDPFITYRYAANLSGGEGLVYNPGERVLSTTTPLFALLLAGIQPFSADLHASAVLIGAASIAAGALLLWDLSHSWKAPVVGWAALALYPTSPFIVSTLSSETPIYLAFCLGVFAAYARRSYPAAGLLGALAVLARPDGMILAGLLIAHYLVTSRGLVSWKAAAAFSLPLLVWGAFSLLYYGSPIPVTLAAKRGQSLLADSASFFEGFLTLAENYAGRGSSIIPAVLALIGVVWLYRRRQWLLFIAWPVLYFASYVLLGITSFFWYYAPLVPGLVVLVGLGLDALAGFLRGRGAAFQRTGTAVVLLLIALGAAFQITDLQAIRDAPDPRRQAYQAVGEWLFENTDQDELVGTLEVGIIGYYAGNPMLDFSGLIQPDVAEEFIENSTYEAGAIRAVQIYQPQFLVLHSGLMPELEAVYAGHFCRAAITFPQGLYGYDQELVVYDCR